MTTATATKTIAYQPYMREMDARFSSACAACGQRIAQNARIYWTREMGAAHVACIAKPSETELAAQRAEAERLAAEQAERVAANKRESDRLARAERKARKAELIAKGATTYSGHYDSYNSIACDRCGTAGYFSHYGHVQNGKCFKCGGMGYVMHAQVPQPKDAKQVAVTLDDAVVGSIVADNGGTYYRVERITWRMPRGGWQALTHYNQKLHLTRLVDGDTKVALLREARDGSNNTPLAADDFIGAAASPVIWPSDAMIDREVERDEHGKWVVF